mgnify:CR=1 FL=1
MAEVNEDFHSQRSAIKKQYSYYFLQSPCAVPHLDPLSFWAKRELDVKPMRVALRDLVGEHDFKPFQAAGGVTKTTVREIFEADLEWREIGFPGFSGLWQPEHKLLQLRLVGSGFLKQMVRGIAGTLVQIGEGRMPSDQFKKILKTQDRRLLGPTSPGHGLWLEKVWYPADLGWE